MNNFKTISILGLLFFCSTVGAAQSFSINGTANDLDDGTWLYVSNYATQKVLDSTQVIKGKFHLAGKSTEKASKVFLYTAKYTNYVTFWVENTVNITVQKGAFKKAVITGSPTQDEDQQLAQLRKPLQKRQDSIYHLLDNSKDPAVKKELQGLLKVLKKEEQEFDIAYVKNNPNSLVAASLLDIYAVTWGKQTTSALYANFSTAMKNTSYGQNIKQYIALNQDIKVGDRYVDFELKNTVGKKIKLSAIKGKYILLEFWASNCGPCREENPNLVKTYARFKGKGLNILGISNDHDKQSWLKAIKDDQLTWENVGELKGNTNSAALIYSVNAYPTNFLIDEKGVIIAKNLRGAALDKKLQELLP